MSTRNEPTGACFIAGEEVSGRGTAIRARDARTGEEVGPDVHDADAQQVAQAARASAEAAPLLRSTSGETRAAFLERIADELEDRREALVAAADRESGLGPTRLQGELGRTTGQLRMFAAVVRRGDDVLPVIDPADPSATPPRPDLRRMRVPLGPVVVFGASNFPLAFSVPGGDTASALAVGCPVIAKSHPAHPETSELAARAIVAAVAGSSLPAGTFSLIHGAAPEVGAALVTAEEVTAVGFTGSERAGRALFDLAVRRERPIPVYAEMGSLNPLLLTSAALRERGQEIVAGLAGSVTLGNGQFCTKPGVVVVPPDAAEGFVAALTAQLEAVDPVAMLTPGIASAFDDAVARTGAIDGVGHAVATPASGATVRGPQMLVTDLDTVLANEQLRVEHFGPATIVVEADPARWVELIRALPGNLTAGLHAQPEELDGLVSLVEELREHAGRVLFDGFPTGVAVTAAQHHGGPYPAATYSTWTSVGTAAIERWLRGVTFQDLPDPLLPKPLRDGNPLGLERIVDGERTTGAVQG